MALFSSLVDETGAALGATPPSPYGRWLDPMFVLLNDDGRNITVFTAVRFETPTGVVYTIPDGFVSDGATLPRAAWSLLGGPLSGKYRRASVLHDYLLRTVDKETAHLVFRWAMQADGCSEEQVEQFYTAVVVKTWWDRSPRIRRAVGVVWSLLKRIV